LAAPFDALLRYAGNPITILGKEHLDALPEQVILAGTHRSFPDLILVRYALAHSRARRLLPGLITANAAGPHFAGGYAWFGVLALGLHPIDQRRGRDTSLRSLVRVARAGGGSVLVFPQGTHTTRERELANDETCRFRAGVAHLAAALELPVVPFGLAGPERVIPQEPDQFQGPMIGGIPLSVQRAPLAIAFGPPLVLAPGELVPAFVERLQDVCYALTAEAEEAISGAPSVSTVARVPASAD
jgi:1-acyl-sn-glycerol-3-phosphate acyltransferase